MAAGIPFSDICNVSVRQAEAILTLYANNKRQEWASLFGMHRMAFHADAKGVKEYLKQLEVD